MRYVLRSSRRATCRGGVLLVNLRGYRVVSDFRVLQLDLAIGASASGRDEQRCPAPLRGFHSPPEPLSRNEGCVQVVVFAVEVAVYGHCVDGVDDCAGEVWCARQGVVSGCGGGVGAPPLHCDDLFHYPVVEVVVVCGCHSEASECVI